MPIADFMPGTDNKKSHLFNQFRDNVGQYLPILGILPTDPDIVQQALDASRFHAMVDFCATMQAATTSWVAEKNNERDGTQSPGGSDIIPALPPDFPAAVPPGIVSRFRALAQRFKANAAYTPSIGQALGIEGGQIVPPDYSLLQPVLSITLSGDQVILAWNWSGYSTFIDMIDLQVDRGDGKGWGILAFATSMTYTDSTPFPATSTAWKYRAIYQVSNAQVGQWSPIASVVVGG